MLLKKSYFILTQKRIDDYTLDQIINKYYSIEEEISFKKIIDIHLMIYKVLDDEEFYKTIFSIMILNYLLLHNNLKAIKLRGESISKYLKLREEALNNQDQQLYELIYLEEKNSRELPEDYYEKLRDIKTVEILSFLTEIKEYLQSNYNIEHLALFGSFADDKQQLHSDIDLIIKFKRATTFMRINKYKQELEKMIYEKFSRFADIHVENANLDEHEIKIKNKRIVVF